MEKRVAYTGRPRQRKTTLSVRVGEVLSRVFITFGGIGTIVAIVTVFAFLFYVVFPLFQSASLDEEYRTAAWEKTAPIHVGLDEDLRVVWGLFADGHIELVDLKDGKVLHEEKALDGPRLTAWSFAPGSPDAAFGFEDGSIRTGRIRITTRFLDPAELPEQAKNLKPDESVPFEKGMLSRTRKDQYRVSELQADIKAPAKGDSPSPVVLIEHTKTTTGVVIASLNAAGKLRLNTVEAEENLLTGETVYTLSGSDLPYTEPAGKGPPSYLFMDAQGLQVYVFWKSGHMIRYDARKRSQPSVAETRDLLEGAHLSVTAIRPLIGNGTFLVGDSSGRIRAWFYANSSDAKTPDGGKMVCGHDFPATGAKVTSLAVSDRTRLAAATFADRSARILCITNERDVIDFKVPGDAPVTTLAFAPKDDGLIAVSGGVWTWKIDMKHPEINARALLSKVWYEGYDAPQYMWQSSGGNQQFEPKFSLLPLIFGTLKASFYSLLFGMPIALLAAIYTSEFLHPRTRALIKPTIELMASLPSVVLGFLAGLVFAQFVERFVPAVLASMITVPLSFLCAAHLWQLLPDKVNLYLSRWKFAFICLTCPIGILAALPAGSLLESVLFGGDMRSWLNGQAGHVLGGWIFLTTPVCALATLIFLGQYVNPWLRNQTRHLGKRSVAYIEIAKLMAAGVFTLGIAVGLGWTLSAGGLDPRGSLVGPYSQRNALVVGFIMGFAIIPIIYTLAEDALSSVPEHLRAGSLAAGATRWQTAVRIVIPTAMSGLFSAVMIGLGRAVGETMIVLMATGNTPVMDWSIFSGFRTLSANIAVELPEAVKDSTHYRTLFLAALTLFAITFVLNTLAEFVRLRFRKRAYQL